MEQNFVFCEWEPYVVKTNSVFNKLKIYANTSFVFPLSEKSYNFSETLNVPPSKRQKNAKNGRNSIFLPFFICIAVRRCVKDAAPYGMRSSQHH